MLVRMFTRTRGKEDSFPGKRGWAPVPQGLPTLGRKFVGSSIEIEHHCDSNITTCIRGCYHLRREYNTKSNSPQNDIIFQVE